MIRRISMPIAMTMLVIAIGLHFAQANPAHRTQTSATKPEQLHISFGEDPTSMMRIVWQTQNPSNKRIVEYGVTSRLGMSADGKRPTYAYETGAIAEVTLQNLKPDTTYYYRAGDPDGGWSATHTFRTAPTNPREFTFTAFGDHGISPDSAKNVQNVLTEKSAFHLLLGDVSYANGNQPIWDQYLKQIEPMACTIPYMPTLGNHENEKITVDGEKKPIGYVSYLARFALPGVETWYSFDYGSARFVAFNSDDYNNPAQLEWLEKTLSEARATDRIKWLIVYQHHPLYGSSKNRDDNAGLIQKILPIFDKYKVDVVLAGHDHHYERQYPMREGKATSKAKTGYRKGEGTLYVKQGGGGKSLYDFTDPWPEVCAYREKTIGYLRVTVRRNGPLTIESKRTDGSSVEKIEIKN